MKKNSIFAQDIEPKILSHFFLILTTEAIVCLVILLILPKSVGNAWLLGYSLNRVLLISIMAFISVALGTLAFGLWKRNESQEKLFLVLKNLRQSEKKLEIILNVLSVFLLLLVFLLVLWGVTKDKFYLAYLTRFGPVIVFFTLFVLHTLWLFLLNYSGNRKMLWYWSLLLGGFLVFLQEWALIINNKIDQPLLIGLLLYTTYYTQFVFRKNFNLVLWGSWILASVLIWILIYLEFFFIPKSFLPYKQIFLTFSPLVMTTLAVVTDMVYGVLSWSTHKFWVRVIVFALVLLGVIYVGKAYYTIGTEHAKHVNTAYETFDDELAYMRFVIEAKETNFRYTGMRNQMPIYPYVQALFYEKGMSLDELFAHGKHVNIWLSLLVLGFIFFIAFKFLSLGETINLILITAFGLYALKSGYFMAELLYYALSFSAYLGMCLLLVRPSSKLGITTGILLGLGHLTKASILPGFLLFVVVFGIKYLALYLWRDKNSLNYEPLKNLSLVALCFLIIISPYILESKKIYGSYFYNVNSTFYMWYDSYEEAINGTIAHGDGIGWPDMPADEIPSPSKYFKEHSLADIVERVRYGLHWQVENITYQYSFFNYPIFLSAFFLLTLLLNLKVSVQLLREHWVLVLFVLGYLLAYFSLYVWYSVISSMSRFLFALYLPFVFSVFIAVKELTGKINFPFIKMANVLVFLMATIDIWYLLSYGPFFRDFGS